MNPLQTATNSNLPVSGRTVNHSLRQTNHHPQSRVADLARSHPTTHASARWRLLAPPSPNSPKTLAPYCSSFVRPLTGADLSL